MRDTEPGYSVSEVQVKISVSVFLQETASLHSTTDDRRREDTFVILTLSSLQEVLLLLSWLTFNNIIST